MRRSNRNRSTWLAAAATIAAAGVLYLSPPGLQRGVRSVVLDLVASGQADVLVRYESMREFALSRFAHLGSSGGSGGSSIAASPDTRIAVLEQTCRRLRLENARLRDELSLAEKYGVSPVTAFQQKTAERPFVVRAALIGDATQNATAEQVLSSGRLDGLAAADAVLEGSGPHLDQGSEAGVESELDVLIGRCIVGRIAAVGRWTSVLQPVTDPRYRGLAQVVRPSDQGGGGSFGAEGILAGQGAELCKLMDVPTTQTVRVGDDVYTSDRDRRFPIPLYYGRVVQVGEAGRNWDISVRPAVQAGDLKTVDVLRFKQAAGRPLAE